MPTITIQISLIPGGLRPAGLTDYSSGADKSYPIYDVVIDEQLGPIINANFAGFQNESSALPWIRLRINQHTEFSSRASALLSNDLEVWKSHSFRPLVEFRQSLITPPAEDEENGVDYSGEFRIALPDNTGSENGADGTRNTDVSYGFGVTEDVIDREYSNNY
ncbi:hypothetical protein GYMLUDRAFT_251421 [Collybiopsis luxurians FD-317 M1]|uniref:Uncharacterized protein n=1 Tax=Collybiopsis luxurians FD-317 M1 TaxID=944289 RepID=A0A0D0C2T7_9AGAR|nr:hypothetical protein GYMLUDRAFT_251421 [Collybiopsis luxurians FD-317 M1]